MDFLDFGSMFDFDGDGESSLTEQFIAYELMESLSEEDGEEEN